MSPATAEAPTPTTKPDPLEAALTATIDLYKVVRRVLDGSLLRPYTHDVAGEAIKARRATEKLFAEWGIDPSKL